jgi:hypothetical protein
MSQAREAYGILPVPACLLLLVLCQNMVGENQPDLGGFGTIPKANRFG